MSPQEEFAELRKRTSPLARFQAFAHPRRARKSSLSHANLGVRLHSL